MPAVKKSASKKPSVEVVMENGTFTVSVPLIHNPSESGKSILIANTGGAVPTIYEVDGHPLKVQVLAYIPNK